MEWTRKGLIASLAALGALLVLGTAAAYRAIIERWEGDPRGTLIAAATVGISFFISMNMLLAWDERRRRSLGMRTDSEVPATRVRPPEANSTTKRAD
jgi:hypothetical protein